LNVDFGICNFELPNRLLPDRRQTHITFGITVRGCADFQQSTRDALALLQPLAQFEIIRANIAVIRQGKRSGMRAWTVRPTFVVGKPTWSHSPLWYAGAIAHDAYHAALYGDAKKRCEASEPDADSWTGVEAEKQCLAFQREVMVALNADDKIVRYIDRCAQDPTYQGRNRGWRGWLDYLKRRW
jgi:hypothetical protein